MIESIPIKVGFGVNPNGGLSHEERIERCEIAIERLCWCLQKYGVDSRDMKMIKQYIRGEIEGKDEPLP